MSCRILLRVVDRWTSDYIWKVFVLRGNGEIGRCEGHSVLVADGEAHRRGRHHRPHQRQHDIRAHLGNVRGCWQP